MPDPREPLGRLVHDIRLACEAARAEAEGRQRFNLPPWEERDEFQRELDMAIGHAVAVYALTENALTYGISCPSCAAKLDRVHEEYERAVRAEAKLAAIAKRCRDEHGSWIRIQAILAITDEQTQERSDERESP